MLLSSRLALMLLHVHVFLVVLVLLRRARRNGTLILQAGHYIPRTPSTPSDVPRSAWRTRLLVNGPSGSRAFHRFTRVSWSTFSWLVSATEMARQSDSEDQYHDHSGRPSVLTPEDRMGLLLGWLGHGEFLGSHLRQCAIRDRRA